MSDTIIRKSHRNRRALIAVVVLLALVGLGYIIYQKETPTTEAYPKRDTVPVALSPIEKGNIDVLDEGLGTVTPLANITVRTQINGQLQEIAFQEGQIVQQGDFLAQIDPRPFQMVLEQAQGSLHKDQALLHEAQLDLARYQKLAAQDSIAKQQLDTQNSLVQQYEGAVVTDQGNIDAANLNITYCHIVAPVSGRVGLRQVDAGNYVQTSDTNGLVTLTQLDPISVLFTLPEDELPAIMKRLAAGAALDVVAFDRSGTNKIADGKLISVDNQIDVTTGTVKLRAQFYNPSNALYPNQFVNMQLTVDTIQDAVLAPQAAILRGAPGTFVYLANDDGTVSVRKVRLGVAQGDNVEIVEGLAVGDKVVTDGTDKLRDGAKYKLPEGSNGPATDGNATKPTDKDTEPRKHTHKKAD